jgi:hypothetical protein
MDNKKAEARNAIEFLKTRLGSFDAESSDWYRPIIVAMESYASLREAQLKTENMALRSFLLSMSEGSAYLEKKVELLFKTLEPPRP